MPAAEDVVVPHQRDPLPGEADRTRGAVVRAGALLGGVVHQARKPCRGQQIRPLLQVRVAALEIGPLREHRAQHAAPLPGAAGFDGVDGHGGGMQPRVVVRAVHAAAERIVQQGFGVDGSIPRRGQGKRDAQPVARDAKRSPCKRRRVHTLTLRVQALPVDLPVVRPRPQSNVAKLPQADAAAHKVLVGVQDQVQQVLMRRHGEKTVNFSGLEVGKKPVQVVVRVLGGVKQAAVQLDIQRAALFRVGHLVRRGQLVLGRVGGQAVFEQRLVAGGKFAVRDVEIVVSADAVILQRIQTAAKLALDYDGVQSRRAELLVKGGKRCRAHGLAQHLRDDLLPGGREQRGVFRRGGRRAGGLKHERQQLLLPRQRKNGRPVHVFSGYLPAGNGHLDDMQKLCFGRGQGHVRVPSPFFVFFDGVCGEQGRRAEQRAERVAEHVVRLRKSQREAILRVLDPRAEQTAGKYCDADPPPVVPSPRQRIRERQPQREEEEDVHQHLTVELRLHPRSGEGGKGGEDEAAAAGHAGQEGGVENDYQRV